MDNKYVGYFYVQVNQRKQALETLSLSEFSPQSKTYHTSNVYNI